MRLCLYVALYPVYVTVCLSATIYNLSGCKLVIKTKRAFDFTWLRWMKPQIANLTSKCRSPKPNWLCFFPTTRSARCSLYSFLVMAVIYICYKYTLADFFSLSGFGPYIALRNEVNKAEHCVRLFYTHIFCGYLNACFLMDKLVMLCILFRTHQKRHLWLILRILVLCLW